MLNVEQTYSFNELVENAQTVIANATESLNKNGFILLSDLDLGISLDDRRDINNLYNKDTLQNELPDVSPPDRLRGRDVICYRWIDGQLQIREHSTITITTPKEVVGNHPHEIARKYKRVSALANKGISKLIRRLLCIVPPTERQPKGSVGINLFKTFNDVVTGPHQDGVQFVGIYIPDKNCNGAETTLITSVTKKIILKKLLRLVNL